jgi:predicted dehydrogenase
MMTREGEQLGLAVIGCGRWGPNHIRVFSDCNRSRVVACADTSKAKLKHVASRFNLRTTTDYRELLDDPQIGAVVIATPTASHAEITRQALQAGKHVLVEKPLCSSIEEGHDLVRLARETHLVLMVGHVFLFNNGINKLKELITSGELGRIHYLDATRTNLGPIRGDVNALYDLATHDISIFNYLVGAMPTEVSAIGRCISQKAIEDVCFATLKYPDGTLGHIHVSWMNPRKVRTMTIVGEKKMAHWDDINTTDPVCIFDKGVDEEPYYDSFGEFHYLLRSGEMHAPALRQTEPLTNQAQAFLDWVLKGKAHESDAEYGLNVVRVLKAAMRSMRNGGAMCPVDVEVPDLFQVA